MQEIWKDIEGYEGLYQISNLGRVKSLIGYDLINHKHYNREKNLQLQDDKNGYKVINLTKNKKVKNIKIHRLVAKAFIVNPQNKPQVNHIDGNKQNNCANNLEWCNCRENMIHAYSNNLVKTHKTPIEQYSLDGTFLRKWNSISEAVITLNLNPCAISGISSCCKHKTPTAHGYIWEYSNNLEYRHHV